MRLFCRQKAVHVGSAEGTGIQGSKCHNVDDPHSNTAEGIFPNGTRLACSRDETRLALVFQKM